MDKYQISEAIDAIIRKLYEAKVTSETTADEMVREYWKIVETFPIAPHELDL